MRKVKEKITVFFAVDDNYIDFLTITIKSIVDNAKDESYAYNFYIINNGLNKESKNRLSQLSSKRFRIKYFNVNAHLTLLESRFQLRDYYTMTTYYRLLIPDAFFFIDKALYLDCDIVVNDDLSKLYNTPIGDNLLGAIKDASVQIVPEFYRYVKTCLSIEKENYFNAGVLVMNLAAMRKTHLLKRVLDLGKTTIFKVAQDQDLLNVVCKDRVTYIDPVWNVMPLGERVKNPSLIHYNLIQKPWKRHDVMYNEYFWALAGKVGLEKKLNENLANISPEYYKAEEEGMANLIKLCNYETQHPEKYTRCNSISKEDDENFKMSVERNSLYEKIEQLEKEGKFDVDVNDNPPPTKLYPGDVDYKQKRIFTKILAKYFNNYSVKYFRRQEKKGNLVIDGYEGVENLKNLRTGAIITANHFNPLDCVPIHLMVKKYHRKHKLFKIIKEGNYTFPGIYGKFMRYCNPLPLASDFDVMKEMMDGLEYWLKKGYPVLIYPEQAMWWNYRKPRPTKSGAFHFAAKFMVPVLPTFITMRDTDRVDNDGENIQAYTMHIMPPIYPKKEFSIKNNTQFLQSENDKAWKEIYEKVYGVKLHYTCEGKADENTEESGEVPS